MVYKWREEHTPLFLKYYKNYPCLWNYKTEGYKNKECRNNAIKSIIKDLNITGVTEDIKLKIKSIRTRYNCELTKIKRSTENGSSSDIYVPKLFWFEQANEFLNAVCGPREGISKFRIPEQQSQLPILKTINKCQETPQSKDSRPSRTSNYEQTFENTSLVRSRKRSIDTPTEVKRKQLEIVEDAEQNTENEFDLFCRSLAVQLKQMPLDRGLICQQKLQAVMVQERLGLINASPLTPQDSTDSSYSYV